MWSFSCDFSLHRFSFDSRRALSGLKALLKPYCLLVSKCGIHRSCFEQTITKCEGRFLVLTVWPPYVTTLFPHSNQPPPTPPFIFQPADLNSSLVQLSHNPAPFTCPSPHRLILLYPFTSAHPLGPAGYCRQQFAIRLRAIRPTIVGYAQKIETSFTGC